MLRKISLSVLAFSVLSSVAFAQLQRCMPRSQMIKYLKGSKYSEDILATGKAGKDTIIEFFVNSQTGTFTIVATSVRSKDENGKIAGTSCMIAGGGEFQFQESQPQPEPSKHTRLYQVPTVLPF